MGLSISGEYKNHSRFTDDILQIPKSWDELKEVINDLRTSNRENLNLGFKNKKK